MTEPSANTGGVMDLITLSSFPVSEGNKKPHERWTPQLWVKKVSFGRRAHCAFHTLCSQTRSPFCCHWGGLWLDQEPGPLLCLPASGERSPDTIRSPLCGHREEDRAQGRLMGTPEGEQNATVFTPSPCWPRAPLPLIMHSHIPQASVLALEHQPWAGGRAQKRNPSCTGL